MDEREKDRREQEMLRKTYRFSVSSRMFMANAAIVIICILCLMSAVRYLMMDSRTPHDNEQLTMNIVMFFVLLLIGLFNNFWAPKLFSKVLDKANGKHKETNVKKRAQICDLKSALNKMSQSQGVIIWDTIWGSFFVFMIVAFLVFYKTCNRPVVLGVILFLLIMLVGGHLIGTKINKSRRFDKRLCKYTKQYIDITDEATYIAWVDNSIQKGVISFTGYWLLTDDYMIGRLSDISYEPIAIPRDTIVKGVFFFERRINTRGLPVGILRLQLNNGKNVEFVLGRGNVCNQTLRVLDEQSIPWSQAEMRYA